MSQDYDRGRLEPHRGGMIMLLGILSLFIANIILGPIAWIMGKNDLKKMKEGTMDPEGESQTKTGYICGIIGTLIGVFSLVLTCIIIIVMFAIVIPQATEFERKQRQRQQQFFDGFDKNGGFRNNAPPPGFRD